MDGGDGEYSGREDERQAEYLTEPDKSGCQGLWMDEK